jgi:DNA-directed RNA polymerase specialized sigma24 family protein
VAEADADRFTRIYRATHPRVLAYAMRRTSPDAAREAVSDTFLIAWRRLPTSPKRRCRGCWSWPATCSGQQAYMEILETARVAAIGDRP